MPGGDHPFLEAEPFAVAVGGVAAGIAVSLGGGHVFFTDRLELSALDGRRFASLEAIAREVRDLRSPRLPPVWRSWRERLPRPVGPAPARTAARRRQIAPSAHQVLLSALRRVRRSAGLADGAVSLRGHPGSGFAAGSRPKAPGRARLAGRPAGPAAPVPA